MHRLNRFLTLIFCLSVTLLVSVSDGFSAMWKIAPVRVEIEPGTKSTSISVVNQDQVPVNFQVEAYRWTQDENGNDRYEETKDLIFFPKIFTLDPGKERLIRIGVRATNPSVERAYRLYVREMPSSTHRADGTTVQFVVHFGVPVYVKPLKEETRWQFTEKTVSNGNLILGIKNTGNHGLHLTSIKLRGFSGQKEVFSKEISGALIMAGSKKVFRERIDSCDGVDRVTVQISGEKIAHEDVISVRKEDCRP